MACKVTSVYLNMRVGSSGMGASPDSMNGVTIMLIWDKDYSGLNPLVSDILQDISSGVTGWLSPLHWNNRDRFRILYSKRIAFGAIVGSASAISTVGMTRLISKKIKVGRTAHYKGTGGAQTDMWHGQLLMLLISDSGTLSHPFVDYQMRICFRDT